jgi:hypothetical protein
MAEKTARESVVEVMVNGVVHVIDDITAREHHMDGSFTLVKFLRDVLELKGTKLGCGVGGCVAQSPPPLMHPRIQRHDARTLTCMHEVCGQHCHVGMSSRATSWHAVQACMPCSGGHSKQNACMACAWRVRAWVCVLGSLFVLVCVRAPPQAIATSASKSSICTRPMTFPLAAVDVYCTRTHVESQVRSLHHDEHCILTPLPRGSH